MDTMRHETDSSITGLARGVLDDARELFREEIALARAETRVELSKAMAAGTRFGAAAVAGWFALMFLLVAVAAGIASLFNWSPELNAAVGFGIVAVLLGVTAAAAYFSARSAAREVQPLPRTVESMKENFR